MNRLLTLTRGPQQLWLDSTGDRGMGLSLCTTFRDERLPRFWMEREQAEQLRDAITAWLEEPRS